MARHKRHVAGPDGWSEWDQPVMRGYKLTCCDCGLVHDFEFRVMRVTERLGEREFRLAHDPVEDHLVHFRARRNVRATAAVRREAARKGRD